jgi:hypothetical protein
MRRRWCPCASPRRGQSRKTRPQSRRGSDRRSLPPGPAMAPTQPTSVGGARARLAPRGPRVCRPALQRAVVRLLPPWGGVWGAGWGAARGAVGVPAKASAKPISKQPTQSSGEPRGVGGHGRAGRQAGRRSPRDTMHDLNAVATTTAGSAQQGRGHSPTERYPGLGQRVPGEGKFSRDMRPVCSCVSQRAIVEVAGKGVRTAASCTHSPPPPPHRRTGEEMGGSGGTAPCHGYKTELCGVYRGVGEGGGGIGTSSKEEGTRQDTPLNHP